MSKLRLRHEADKKRYSRKWKMRTLELSAGVFLFVYCRLKTDPVDRSSAVLVLSRRRLGITTTAYARECTYNHIIHLFFSVMTPKVLQSATGEASSFFLIVIVVLDTSSSIIGNIKPEINPEQYVHSLGSPVSLKTTLSSSLANSLS